MHAPAARRYVTHHQSNDYWYSVKILQRWEMCYPTVIRCMYTIGALICARTETRHLS